MKNKRTIILISIIVAVVILTVIITVVFISSNKHTKKPIGENNNSIIEENVIEGPSIVEDDFKEESLQQLTESGKIAQTRSIYADSNGQRAVIPQGYAVVSDSSTIAAGLVISDVPDDDMANSKQGNQFVWIPVENPFLDVSQCTTENQINVAIQEEVDNNRFPMAIRLADGNYAAILYRFESIRENTAIKVIPLTYSATATEKEPTNLTVESTGNMNNWTSTTYQEQFNKLIKRVRNDKGFWVARFETSVSENGKAQSKKGKVALTNKSWYELYEAEKTLSTENVSSHMIWGCQWDQIMIWIRNIRNVEYTKNPFYILDSTGQGNYSDTQIIDQEGNIVKKKGVSIRYSTGIADTFQIRNIYDLAGNVFEWTMESYYSSLRVVRGGYCAYDGATYPISARFWFKPDYQGEHLENIGSRMVIY